MKFHIAYYFLIPLILASFTFTDSDTEFIAGDLGINMGKNGRITHLYDLNKGEDHLLSDSASYLIQMRFSDKIISPESMRFEAAENMLYLTNTAYRGTSYEDDGGCYKKTNITNAYIHVWFNSSNGDFDGSGIGFNTIWTAGSAPDYQPSTIEKQNTSSNITYDGFNFSLV